MAAAEAREKLAGGGDLQPSYSLQIKKISAFRMFAEFQSTSTNSPASNQVLLWATKSICMFALE